MLDDMDSVGLDNFDDEDSQVGATCEGCNAVGGEYRDINYTPITLLCVLNPMHPCPFVLVLFRTSLTPQFDPCPPVGAHDVARRLRPAGPHAQAGEGQMERGGGHRLAAGCDYARRQELEEHRLLPGGQDRGAGTYVLI